MAELIDLEVLRAVELLYKELSYSRAAQQLGIPRSALRMQIAALEQKLEFLVFTEHGDQVTVTSEGKTFLDASRTSFRTRAQEGKRAVAE